MAGRIYNVALIGYGLSAKVFQIPFVRLVPQFKLYSIVQRHPKPNDDAAHDHPDVKVYRSNEEMLKDEKVAVVMIGTSSDSHYTLCKQALEARKHVLCEKPFTMTSKEADELVELANGLKLLLTVFHNRRWDSDFVTVSSLIRNGDLGRVMEFESHFDWHAPLPRPGWESTWRTQAGTGAGVVYDLGSHLIDQALQLFGMPQKVTGFEYHQREHGAKYGDAESMTILLHYVDGLLVTLKASIMNPEKEKLRFWVRGDKGAFKKYHLDVQEPQIVTNSYMPGDPNFGVEPASHYGILSTADQDGNIESAPYPTLAPPTYLALYQQFADALDGTAVVPVKPESASDVIRIIELVKESSALEKTIYVS